MTVQYDYDKARPYKVKRSGLKAPSSNWSDIQCPFCEREVRAYWWSLSGGGKKCLCGAKHDSMGMTSPRKEKTK